MKQKYAVGSALILIGIAATGFLIDENARGKRQGMDSQSAISPGIKLVSSDNTYSNTVPLKVENRNTNNTGDDKGYSLVKEGIGSLEQIRVIYETPVPAGNSVAEIALIKPEKVTADAPKIYYKKVMDISKDKDEKKHHHFHFRLPENTGIELGMNESGISGTRNNGMPAGNFNFGLVYNVNMGDHMAFQPGIRYITSGTRLQNEMEIDNKEKLTMDNIEVPANLIWKPGKIGNARIMIGAGPYVAYMAGAKDKYQATPYTDDGAYIPSTQQYNTAIINKLNWGMGGFVGIQSPDGFYLKAGGEYSMKDLMKNTSVRTYSLMVNIGFIMGNKL